jgi:sulfotransferase family protein
VTLLRLGALLLILFVVQLVHLALVLRWSDRYTEGLAYYGATAGERRRFRRRLRLHRWLLAPSLWLQSRLSKLTFARMSFRAEGLVGPSGTCSPESFAKGRAWQAGPQDIFVATQMKGGTTWMLHVVYQILRRGGGDLVETGSTLHAVCPWLEGRRTVSMEAAPLVGAERPARIIKTHFPASHVPWSDQARYICVARHPVSCYASTADFIRENTGPFSPPEQAIEQWFTSEEAMWWGTWPAHIAGWWDLSARPNVLFIAYEEMTGDLDAVVRRVTEFLGESPLSERERAAVLEKCSFRYMRAHQEAFEMHPPQILGTDVRYFVKGTSTRHEDVDPERKQRLSRWSAGRLAGTAFPLARYYPDLAEA